MEWKLEHPRLCNDPGSATLKFASRLFEDIHYVTVVSKGKASKQSTHRSPGNDHAEAIGDGSI